VQAPGERLAMGFFYYVFVLFFTTDALNSDRYVLIDLFNSTDGMHWSNSNGWGSTSSVCVWFGVTCDNDIITGLNLPR
jgi:hypothetical protein